MLETVCAWCFFQQQLLYYHRSCIQHDNEGKYKGAWAPYIHDDKRISPRIILSSLLGNEAHVDFKDQGLSVVVWLAEYPVRLAGP